ncbi:GD21622 [Drosophila simulans]|uniref:GD21622 n=1 Tax=Drosophila simulans TaxID=7240 RepID=B4Q4H7_DROSI|nr:GD21622 [Drosophila simulans]
MDSPKKNKNPQNRPAKFTITAYEDNAKDHFSDLEVNNLIDGNHKKNNIGVTLKAQQNRVQPVDKGLYVKESEKGSDHFICQQHKKNILEPGELSEDDTSEAQKVRCAYKTSDLEDGEVSCEGLDVPHNLIKKTSLCQFDNTIFKKRNISVDKKVSRLESCELFEDTFSTPQHDQVESVDLEDGELFGEDNEVSSNTIKKEDNRMPFCRYHIRNSCIWGQNCRFRHPNLNKLGKYVMFEKKCLPVPTVTFPPARDTYPMAVIETMSRMPESLDISFGMNNMDNDPYYTQNEPEVDKRAPLLQTPTFSELLTEQKQYHNSLAGNRPIRTPPPARYSRNLRSTVQANRSSFLTCLEKRDRSPRLPRYSASKNPQPQISLSNIRRPSSIIVRLERKRQRLSDSTFSSSDSSESSSYESTTESTDDVSSFSESDARGEKNSSSSLGIPIKNMKRNEEKFSSDAVAKFTAKRPHSPKFRNQKQTFSKLSTKTPLRNPPNVLPNAPKKPHSILESSYSIKKKQDRQKRLLMQLLRVEQQIAKKKKHRMKAFKE